METFERPPGNGCAERTASGQVSAIAEMFKAACGGWSGILELRSSEVAPAGGISDSIFGAACF